MSNFKVGDRVRIVGYDIPGENLPKRRLIEGRTGIIQGESAYWHVKLDDESYVRDALSPSYGNALLVTTKEMEKID